MQEQPFEERVRDFSISWETDEGMAILESGEMALIMFQNCTQLHGVVLQENVVLLGQKTVKLCLLASESDGRTVRM